MNKSLSSFLFIAALIAYTNGACELPHLNIKQSIFDFALDDIVTGVYINDNQITLPFDDEAVNTWNVVRTITLNLVAGDKISFKGKSIGGPIGLVGTLRFYTPEGDEIVYNTGADWECNDVPAIVLAKNDGSFRQWPKMVQIETAAKWIWSTKSQPVNVESTCSFTIPKSVVIPMPPNPNCLNPYVSLFEFALDDITTKVGINGQSIPFPLDETTDIQWGKLRTYHMKVCEGDTIEFTGKSIGGPVGLVGTFFFINEFGVKLQYSTSNLWKCNGKPAVIRATNNGNFKPWPIVPEIKTTAKWIWSTMEDVVNVETTCSYVIPPSPPQ